MIPNHMLNLAQPILINAFSGASVAIGPTPTDQCCRDAKALVTGVRLSYVSSLLHGLLLTASPAMAAECDVCMRSCGNKL